MGIQASIFIVPLVRFVWISGTLGIPAVHGEADKDANFEPLRGELVPEKAPAHGPIFDHERESGYTCTRLDIHEFVPIKASSQDLVNNMSSMWLSSLKIKPLKVLWAR